MAGPNLFKKAKDSNTGATASKPTKEEVVLVDPKFHSDLSRLAEIQKIMDELGAEGSILSATVKQRGIREFTTLYDKTGKYPGSFNIRATGLKGQAPAALMFIPTDKYIKIDEDRYNELISDYGEGIAKETTVYTMDAALIEKHGETISALINNCKTISDDDKAKLISASSSYSITKGTISELPKYPATITEMLEQIVPIYQLKNIRIEEEVNP